MSVSVVIPAYNEEKSIADTIEAVKGTGLTDEIIVVDDGSSDKTSDTAKAQGVKVLRCDHNGGKGKALQVGIDECKGDIIVFLDADVGKTGDEIYKIIIPICKGECDVAIARFGSPNKKGGFGMVKWISRTGVSMLTGHLIYSVLSGQRAFKRQVIENISISTGYGAEVGMTIDILRKGYCIKEYDVAMTHRETGRDISGFMHRGKQMVQIIRVLFSKSMIKERSH